MRFFKQEEMYDSIYFYKLHPNEYSQEFCYYPFAVKLDRCVGSCNTINDVSFSYDYRKKWIKTFNKTHVMVCKCKFQGSKCDSN